MLGRLLRNVRAGKAKMSFSHRVAALVPKTIQITSSAFAPGGEIPARFTQSGENLSPSLQWAHAPSGTRSVVIVVEDPDAPLPIPFVHAIAYNLPAEGVLAEGAIPNRTATESQTHSGQIQIGKSTFGKALYRGPGPIPDHGPHDYCFQVFALDCTLTFPSPPRRREILTAIESHLLAKGLLVGTYERRSRR